jgi:hypothetical protein
MVCGWRRDIRRQYWVVAGLRKLKNFCVPMHPGIINVSREALTVAFMYDVK